MEPKVQVQIKAVPFLYVNGESLCSLHDVIIAINNIDINRTFQRGNDEFQKVKIVIPQIMDKKSLISYFSSGNLWRVDEEHPDDDLTWALVSSLSSLCTFPLIIMAIFQNVELPAKFEYAKNDPLLLNFALRNVLARLAFHT